MRRVSLGAGDDAEQVDARGKNGARARQDGRLDAAVAHASDRVAQLPEQLQVEGVGLPVLETDHNNRVVPFDMNHAGAPGNA